jgi:hypothetical protein
MLEPTNLGRALGPAADPIRKASIALALDPCGRRPAICPLQKEAVSGGPNGREPAVPTPRIVLPEWIANGLRGAA